MRIEARPLAPAESDALPLGHGASLLYSKVGVYRGIHYFLIFALKHRLWILARTAVITCTHNLFFEQIEKIIKKNQLEIVIFTAIKIRSILYIRVIVMCD